MNSSKMNVRVQIFTNPCIFTRNFNIATTIAITFLQHFTTLISRIQNNSSKFSGMKKIPYTVACVLISMYQYTNGKTAK